MKKIRLFGLLSVLALSVVALGACSDDDDAIVSPSMAETSLVNIIHTSPDAPAVDVYVDNAQAVNALAFPNNTGYVDINSGVRNVKVTVAGSGSSSPVIEANLDLNSNTTYSVFAIDEVDSIDALVLIDDLTPPAAGFAHVRFIHLSPDAPAVDIALANGGAVIFPNNAFTDYTAFTPLAAGTYNLEVRVAGTATVALPLPGITLEAGKIYTVFARGFLSGTGAQALGAEIIVNLQ